MPLIFNLQCNKCDFKIKHYAGPVMYLRDGAEDVVLPHPLEDSVAEKLTGRKLDDLAKEGLVIFKDPKICVSCLKNEEDCTCEAQNLVEIGKLIGVKCPKCGEGVVERVDTGMIT